MPGRHRIEGLDGDDKLTGGASDDSLYGGNGRDILIGGGGTFSKRRRRSRSAHRRNG